MIAAVTPISKGSGRRRRVGADCVPAWIRKIANGVSRRKTGVAAFEVAVDREVLARLCSDRRCHRQQRKRPDSAEQCPSQMRSHNSLRLNKHLVAAVPLSIRR